MFACARVFTSVGGTDRLSKYVILCGDDAGLSQRFLSVSFRMSKNSPCFHRFSFDDFFFRFFKKKFCFHVFSADHVFIVVLCCNLSPVDNVFLLLFYVTILSHLIMF